MISVILVTYNSMAVLPNCINSLENSSSAQELEIIVVDNGSVDGTVEWLRIYEQDARFPFDKVIVLLMKENRGYAYANNRAMEIARGDVFLLLNPDTIVSEDTISVCTGGALWTDKRMGAVGCRLIRADGSLDRACRRSFPTLWNSLARFSGLSLLFPRWRLVAAYNLTYLDEFGVYSVDCLSGAFMMVPRAVVETVGGLDEDFFMYGEDIEWCYRIRRAGFDVWYEGSVSTIHLKGGNGGKRSPDSLKHFYDSMYVYFSKTRGPGFRVTKLLVRQLIRLNYYTHLLTNTIKVLLRGETS